MLLSGDLRRTPAPLRTIVSHTFSCWCLPWFPNPAQYPSLFFPQSRIFSASIVCSIAKTLGEVGSLHRCHTFESSEITFFFSSPYILISFDRYNHVYVMHIHACIFIFVTVNRKRRKQDKKESGLKIERRLETILRTRSLQVAEVTWSTLLGR